MGNVVLAFRTISEVAKEVGVATHVLRFWETKFSEIKPMKRNGGRRYYRLEDVELLSKIRYYLYDKRYTIEGVQKMIAKKGVKVIVKKDKVISQNNIASFLDKPLEINNKNKDIVAGLIEDLKNMRRSLELTLENIDVA